MSPFQIDDPFLHAIRRAGDMLDEAVDFLRGRPSIVTCTFDRRRELEHLSSSTVQAAYNFRQLRFAIESDEKAVTNLSYAVDNFGRFQQAHKEACKLIGRMLAEIHPDMPEEDSKAILRGLHKDFGKVFMLYRRITTSHVVLQGHFQYLVTSGPSVEVSVSNGESLEAKEKLERQAELFGSLETLRDQFFLKPTPGLVTEYLQEVAVVEASAVYRGARYDTERFISDLFLARLDKWRLELEVKSLLEVIE